MTTPALDGETPPAAVSEAAHPANEATSGANEATSGAAGEEVAEGSRPARRARWRRWAANGAAALSGTVMAFSLPPWGWWPLTFVAWAALGGLTAGRPARRRFVLTWWYGLGWLLPGMGWMWFFTIPGWLVASMTFAVYLGVAVVIAPAAGRWRVLGFPAAIGLAEALRWSWPFGGVPLASVAIAQAAGPLAPVVRVGGSLGLTVAAVAIGSALAAAGRRQFVAAIAAVTVVAGLLLAGLVAPRGHDIGEIAVATVQGGGPQGTRATSTDSSVVFERHVEATALVRDQVDLVLWPENVVNVGRRRLEDSAWYAELAELTRRHRAVLAVGVTEGVSPGRFTNAQVAFGSDGLEIDRYDKVKRVPFGEYMPLRSFLRAIGAPTDLVPNDAVAGSGPAVLHTPVGVLGVVISWEVFFGGRARDAVQHDAQVLLNPTNGASYVGTVLQTQQVASSRLRAMETDRWVVQAAPTGFSAFISPDGDVLQRTGQREQAVIQRVVPLREGTTVYERVGDRIVVLWLAALLAVSVVFDARARQRAARYTRFRHFRRPRRHGTRRLRPEDAPAEA